mmetsp:Transcript_25497/g.57615  ORF Transcript_25497/g.57615 Transcript_25497/m.57615 type:complete len:934 (-) Transcript_25497:1703-4504(-)
MMSPGGRRSSMVVAMDELKKREDLESLRKHLIDEKCFPAQKDPDTCVITMEELKKLARIFKLNERRNFWKNHSERHDMVAALLEHVQQNQNYMTKKVKVGKNEDFKPTPPVDFKPSVTRQALIAKLQDYCGIKYFNRDSTESELIITSRFYDFPDPTTHIETVIDTWREEDFNMVDEAFAENVEVIETISDKTKKMKKGGGGIRNKARAVKHRNLATHLMNYSANPELNKASLTLKSVQTFINVSESEDSATVSNCMIALSNIASHDHVRALLMEANALHKFANMLQHLRGKASLRAAGLLFYYFSCDKESEDRVYNACSAFLQGNGASKDLETRMLSLYTLNNLMPCIDRQRVTDVTMRVIHSNFEASLSQETQHDKILTTYLQIMQNISCFSNAHSTLLGMKVLELMAQVASLSVKQNNPDLAIGVLKIMMAFLQAQDQVANLITLEYVDILMTLFELHHEASLIQCARVATTLTTLPALLPLLRSSRLVRTVSAVVMALPLVTNKFASELSKYFTNMTVFADADAMSSLVEDDMQSAVLRVLKDPNASSKVKSVAVQALQNLLSVPSIGVKLVAACLDPLVRFLREVSQISGAMALYNISCIPQCRGELIGAKIHVKILEFFISSRKLDMKSALLQILVQMSSSNVCVLDLLQEGLISKLEAQLQDGAKREVWNDISLLLLAVVAFAADDLKEEEQISIVQILTIICVSGVEDQVAANCSNVLKYVSIRYAAFAHMNPVVRAILTISSYDKEEVVENLSNVLYNMTCDVANVQMMLADAQYVDIMIHIMRNGNLEVQENIAQAMRNLCSHAKCTEILLKTDILSDLIVIALLRTSSEEIKIVCAEAFYNMLCHRSTRLKLLRGDLWWAVMRLCRTDSHQVRSTCARALFDLSTDIQNVAPLRSHHVLSFVKDIISSGNEVFFGTVSAVGA